MPVTTRNTELIPQSELNQLIKYNAELTTAKNNLGAIIPVLHEAALGVERYTGDYQTLVKMLKSFEKIQQDTNTRVKEHNQAATNLEKAIKRLSFTQSEEAKKLAEVQEQTRKNNLELRNAAKESLAAENSLEQLRATLSRLKAEANTKFNVDSEEYVKAAANVRELNDKILASEASMGDHRRNVGNYASGFNALGFQVQQVARELPSLTVSSQQFFLAISNNLPMLADEIAATIAKNKELRKENLKLAVEQQTQIIPAWKQMLKSILGWQTAIVVGITLVTAYSKEIGQFFKELFTGEKTLSATERTTRMMNQTMAKGVESAQGETVALTSLYKAATDVTLALDKRTAAVQEMQTQYPDYLGNLTKEKILAGEAASEYDKLKESILKAAITRANEEQLTENAKKLAVFYDPRLVNEYEAYMAAAGAHHNNYNIGQKGMDRQHNMDESARALRDAIEKAGHKDLLKEMDKLYGEDRFGENIWSFVNDLNAANDSLVKEISGNIDTVTGLIDKQQKEIERLTALKATITDESSLAALNKELAAAEAELERLQQLGLPDEDSGQTTGSGGRLSEKREAELRMLQKQAEYTAEIQEEIYQNEELSYQERIAAFDQFKTEQEKALTIHYDALREELAARKTAGDIDEGTYATLLTEINENAGAEMRELMVSQEEAGKELMDSIAKGMMKEAEQAVTQATTELDDKMQAELKDLAQKYAAGEIDTEEYEKSKNDTIKEYRTKRFEAEIGAFDELLTVEGITKEAEVALNKAKDDAVLKHKEYINDLLVKDAEETGRELVDKAEEAAKKEADLKMKLMQEVFNLATALGDAQLKKELNRLDKLSEANEEWKDGEIERIERLEEQGVISKEQAEARKQAIEDQAAAKEKEIEIQRIEAERKNAAFQKATAATKAIINTALAVTAALGTPFLIPLILATGAAQLATILAQPLPEYAHGTSNHPGGLAVVGDGGRSEMVIFPDNTIWRTPPTDTLVTLPAGSQVLPDYDAVISQFAISRFTERPANNARMEALLEAQNLQRNMLIEKSCERNMLLRQLLSTRHIDRRAANRERALEMLNKKKLLKR